LTRYDARFVRRWLPLLVLGPLLAGITGFLVLRVIPPIYEAAVILMVQPADAGTALTPDTQVAQDLANTYAEAIHTRRILSEAATQVGLGALSEQDLESRVQARRVPNTGLLRVTADDADPRRAADLANAVAQVFVQHNADIQANRFASSRDNLAKLVAQLQAGLDAQLASEADLQSQASSPERDGTLAKLEDNLTQTRANYANSLRSYEDLRVSEARATNTVTVFDAAVPPLDPIRPNRTLTILLAAVAGLIAVGGIALMAEYLDDGFRSTPAIADGTGLPTIGILPRGGVPSDLRQPSSKGWTESYNILRSRLMYTMRDQPAHSLMIASAELGEGKSTIAANLAIALARGGHHVILVDTDVRRQSQTRLWKLEGGGGLSHLLQDTAEPVGSMLRPTWLSNLEVMPAGSESPEPSALFTSLRLPGVLHELGTLCDVLVIDTPPVLAQPESVLLGPNVDAVLFVIDARRTRAHKAVRALEILRGSGARVLGAIVNRVAKNSLEFIPYKGSSEQQVDGNDGLIKASNHRPPVSGRRKPSARAARHSMTDG
jgi:non-specific protein-tyrosine kinase